jgi:hypothetical protein
MAEFCCVDWFVTGATSNPCVGWLVMGIATCCIVRGVAAGCVVGWFVVGMATCCVGGFVGTTNWSAGKTSCCLGVGAEPTVGWI